jgi:hypothetical protein
VIDPTKSGYLKLNYPMAQSRTTRGWIKMLLIFHKEGLLIENTSDGVKAFTGVTTILTWEIQNKFN